MLSALELPNLDSWNPPDSASGPQNNNTISYSQAAAASMGCDPIAGCSGSPSVAGAVLGGSPSAATPTMLPGQSSAGSKWNPLTWNWGGLSGVPAGAAKSALTNSTFDFGRWGTFGLGLIVIAGAIYLFKPVQNIVTTAARAAAI